MGCLHLLSTCFRQRRRRATIALAALIKGMFGTFRNTTAHAPKIRWEIDLDDALDLLTLAPMLHRRLDAAHVTPAAPAYQVYRWQNRGAPNLLVPEAGFGSVDQVPRICWRARGDASYSPMIVDFTRATPGRLCDGDRCSVVELFAQSFQLVVDVLHLFAGE